MHRSIALLLLILLAAVTWLRSPRAPRLAQMTFDYVALTPRPGTDPQYHLGAFRLEGAWHMASRSRGFGGYSTLLAMPDGQLLAVSDSGGYLRFTLPGQKPGALASGSLDISRWNDKADRDVESATRDPRTGTIWLGLEGSNSIVRLGPELNVEAKVRPGAIRHWGVNSGPEAMARLADGRFVLLREAFKGRLEDRRHDAVVFEGDPATRPKSWHFTFDGPKGFSPTDMTQLPDGRLLILMRRLVWPMPQRFAGRIAIADPAEIRPGATWRAREVARIATSLPVDNFEGLAAVPQGKDRLTVWLISDDNFSDFQRTLLWKLSVDPRDLP